MLAPGRAIGAPLRVAVEDEDTTLEPGLTMDEAELRDPGRGTTAPLLDPATPEALLTPPVEPPTPCAGEAFAEVALGPALEPETERDPELETLPVGPPEPENPGDEDVSAVAAPSFDPAAVSVWPLCPSRPATREGPAPLPPPEIVAEALAC